MLACWLMLWAVLQSEGGQRLCAPSQTILSSHYRHLLAGALLNVLQQQTAQSLKVPIDGLRLVTTWEAGELQVRHMAGVAAALDASSQLPCNVTQKKVTLGWQTYPIAVLHLQKSWDANIICASCCCRGASSS